MSMHQPLPYLDWPVKTKPSPPSFEKIGAEARDVYLAGHIYKTLEFENDWITNTIVGFGVLMCAIDRTPLPIGESILGASFYLASKRSQRIRKPEYDNSVLQDAISALNSKDKFVSLSMPCNRPKHPNNLG